jgi:hypothetical protein
MSERTVGTVRRSYIVITTFSNFTFELLATVIMNSTIFCIVTTCSYEKKTPDVSDGHIAFIFRIEE